MSNFIFDLPPERIARYPNPVRSHSRLMLVDGVADKLDHLRFDSLPSVLKSGDLLVFNSSRVIAARLDLCKLSGGRVELLLERVMTANRALVLIKSNKSLLPRSRLHLDGAKQVEFEIVGSQNQFFIVDLHADLDWYSLLDRYGRIPLPPYLGRQDEELDKQRYQTVYAEVPGSVAAPTAGLHFDDAVFTKLKDLGIECAWLQLHVGYGTFAPLRCSDIDTLHSERFSIDQLCCDKISNCRKAGGRIVAVGTTTCRVLEHLLLTGGFEAQKGETKLFIKPGFNFGCVDVLVTNFHLPASSLLYLVGAFAGEQLIMKAYDVAMQLGYNFYSYGDAMCIVNKK